MKKSIIHTSILVLGFLCSCVTENNLCIPEPQRYDNSIFRWKNYEANLATNDEWCISRSNSWIAFTNYDTKTQYMVNWEGGMSNGEKENATVSLLKTGNNPLVYKIAYFNVDSDGTDCTINFLTTDKSEGVIHFPL